MIKVKHLLNSPPLLNNGLALLNHGLSLPLPLSWGLSANMFSSSWLLKFIARAGWQGLLADRRAFLALFLCEHSPNWYSLPPLDVAVTMQAYSHAPGGLAASGLCS